ncbi:MAG: dienelactone hydrolase family protein [Novosphingobium sp.]
MAMMNKTIVHGRPDERFESVLVFDDAAPGPVPGILLVPNVMGLKPSDIELASKMAALGYAVLACDIFGQGKRPTLENPTEYMDVLRADRGLLRDRLHASLATLKEQSQVDAHNAVAIGYCFGGQCAIDMVRSGADILGAISFHGVLDAPDYPIVTPAKAKLMILHGWNDPICPPDAVKGIAKELTDAGIDWHLHAYGHAGHSFTHAATTPRAGFGYNEPADRRSWLAMQIFLSELFAEAG